MFKLRTGYKRGGVQNSGRKLSRTLGRRMKTSKITRRKGEEREERRRKRRRRRKRS